MSLGQELAPHLPFLRRYGRALTGSQARGDAFVRATLEAIVADPDVFPRDSDARVGLYRLFHTIWSSADVEDEPGGLDAGGAEGIARTRLSRIRPLSRQALLLTAMEGFAPDEAGYLIGVSEKEVDALVAEALAEIEHQTRADVLIIEDAPIIAMDIETIVRDLGHNVTGVAVTRDDALEKAMARRPGLVLADIQLADDSSGIDAVKDILKQFAVPVIFITAFPERLLTGERPEPTYLITKPYQRSTVKAAIAQALFFDTATMPPEQPEPPAGLKPIPKELVAARLGPVDAKVASGQIRLVDSTRAEPAIPERAVEAVRRTHLATARRLCAHFGRSNVGPGFNARLEGVCRLLARRLTQERGLQLAIQVQGLEAMMGAIDERLDDANAADVAIFVADLVDLLRQFPSYRRFVEEARAAAPINEDAQQAAAKVAKLLEEQPDAVVEPALKDAISGIRELAEDRREPLTALALVRTIGNTLRAVGRFFNTRIAKAGSRAVETFDDIAGKTLARLIVYTPVGALLIHLASLYAAEFGFGTQVLRAAQALLKAIGG